MIMTLIDGKRIAAETKAEIAKKCKLFRGRYGFSPCLAVIIVGDDPASKVYVRNKQKACESVGIRSLCLEYSADVTQTELISKIRELNADETVHGILVQLPLPSHIHEKTVTNAVSPLKDVDGFHPENAGLLALGAPRFVPCTPAGIMEMLHAYSIDPAGKNCVVVGRSDIVGKPVAELLLQANGTVTVCHSKTKSLSDFTRRADILVVAVGKPGFIRADMVKPGAVVVDVGINRKDDGHLCGDVDEAVAEKASFITPVPGGVGPMTIAMLMKNTLSAAEYQVGVR